MMQNEPSFSGIKLLYVAVAMLLAMQDFSLDKGGQSMNTRLPWWKVGGLQTRRS